MTLVLAVAVVLTLFVIAYAGVGPINPGGRNALPGMSTKLYPQQNVFLKSEHKMTRGVTIVSDSEDSENTVAPGAVTKLRAGMALVRVETGANKNKYVPIDHADDPGIGSRVQGGILMESVNMLGGDLVTPVDSQAFVLIHGQVDASKIFYNGAGAGEITDFQELMDQVIFEEPAA